MQAYPGLGSPGGPTLTAHNTGKARFITMMAIPSLQSIGKNASPACHVYGKKITIAEMIMVSPSGVVTVLRLDRDAY